MATRIPLKNIYYLLVYAWDRLPEGDLIDISAVDSTELADLFAAVLIGGLQHLLRRGLEQSYCPVASELAGIRGRVQFSTTTRRMLTRHGRTFCEFDELSVDTRSNQILLATVRRLARSPDLDPGLRDKLRKLSTSLRAISTCDLNKRAFRTVQLHNNNGFYKFLLHLCELILESSIPTEDPGTYRFRDFDRDPSQMARLFEKFILNFCQRECPAATTKSERIRWTAGSSDDPKLEFLPLMQTDISLRRPGRTLIIDAKYYQDTLHRNRESETIHSAHLYQMFSYLKNLEARGGQDASAEGMLLYPVVGSALRLRYEIGGHTLRVCTLNLARDWKSIRQELLELVS